MKAKISVQEIINYKKVCAYAPNIDHGIQDLVAAAYWAGEAKARSEERAANLAAASQAPKSRYRKLLRACIEKFNTSGIEGLMAESMEFSEWSHEIA